MNLAPRFHERRPTPPGVRRFEQADAVNPLPARAFTALRATARHAKAEAPGDFFASDDDLMRRLDLSEWRMLVDFLVERLRATLARANAGVWPRGRLRMRVEIAGIWFQTSDQGAHHDLHNHGDCSWSGVYYVQIDPPEARRARAGHGKLNGATRFHGPYLARLGGADMDLGNAYPQRPHVDIQPEEGLLAIFPAYPGHQALPYAGERDRIVVSFNAAPHGQAGDDRLFGFAPA